MNTGYETEDNVVVPESPLLKLERKNRYGTVPGLKDEELAEPEELERQVLIEAWGPILAIPIKSGHGFRPDVDENGGLDWGAFGSIDFRRLVDFDKARYKSDKLREELKDVNLMLSILMERVQVRAKYLVLKYLRMGLIEFDHIVDPDMQAIARWYLRARRLREKIAEIAEARRWRR